MRVRAFVLLGLAALFAAVSVVLARAWLERQGAATMAAAPAPVELAPVVVAAKPLNYGDVVTAEALRLVSWPASGVPDGAFTEIAAAASQSEGSPRVVLREMVAGEAVLPGKVSSAAGTATLASRIAAGKRAVTVPVSGTRGLGGLVRPSDRVDVLLTRHRGAGLETGRPPVDVLLLDAKVLAADRPGGPAGVRDAAVRSVTLEVSPEEAQKLALAETLGTLSLALRHVPGGRAGEIDSTRSITLEDLVATIAAAGRKAPAAPVAAAAPRPAKATASVRNTSVRVFRGLDAADYSVAREPPSPSRTVVRP